MGGWSIGFYRNGFDCTGIDIVDVGYPYRLEIQDIRKADYRNYSDYKVVVASPPCTEFSHLSKLFGKPGNRKELADPEKGMELVRACDDLITEISPVYWALENVRGSIPYIEPLLGKPRMINGSLVLWGNFPEFMLESSTKLKKDVNNPKWMFNPLNSWLRARIPLPLSLKVAEVCKTYLEDCRVCRYPRYECQC